MKRTIGLGLGIVAALAAAGCSSSSGNGIATDSVSQIQSSVEQAMGAATSVQINGTTFESGKTTTFQIATFSSGDFSGTIEQAGNSLQLRKIGSTDYLKGTVGYYESAGQSASVATLLGGNWVYGPDSQFGFGNSFSISSLVSSVKKPDGTLSKGSSSTINGQAAFSVNSSKGGVMWVATTGPAYPIQLDDSSSSGGTINFSNWNQASAPVAPAGARSLSSFGG
ncbi:MAG: hypothetical protein ACLP6E_08345 [Acidimicrobiales bacterium]